MRATAHFESVFVCSSNRRCDDGSLRRSGGGFQLSCAVTGKASFATTTHVRSKSTTNFLDLLDQILSLLEVDPLVRAELIDAQSTLRFARVDSQDPQANSTSVLHTE